MTGQILLISCNLLPETEWVLRYRCHKSRGELLAFFAALLETENTVIETAEIIGLAVDLVRTLCGKVCTPGAWATAQTAHHAPKPKRPLNNGRTSIGADVIGVTFGT
jgi:hypothetical protein